MHNPKKKLLKISIGTYCKKYSPAHQPMYFAGERHVGASCRPKRTAGCTGASNIFSWKNLILGDQPKVEPKNMILYIYIYNIHTKTSCYACLVGAFCSLLTRAGPFCNSFLLDAQSPALRLPVENDYKTREWKDNERKHRWTKMSPRLKQTPHCVVTGLVPVQNVTNRLLSSSRQWQEETEYRNEKETGKNMKKTQRIE